MQLNQKKNLIFSCNRSLFVPSEVSSSQVLYKDERGGRKKKNQLEWKKILSEPCGRAYLAPEKYDSLILSCNSTSSLHRSRATCCRIPVDYWRTSMSQNCVWKNLSCWWSRVVLMSTRCFPPRLLSHGGSYRPPQTVTPTLLPQKTRSSLL